MKYDPWVLLASEALNKATSNSSSSWVSSVGNSPVKPTDDDFYKYDAQNISQYSLGDILNVREVGLGQYNFSKAWQVLYRSENSFGFPAATVTTIVLPSNYNSTDEPANVVSYQQHEDSSFLDCNPSYSLFGSPDADLQGILDKGYILNFPDHEGKNSSFTAGFLEGKMTLDSLRALKNAQNLTGVNPGPTILWGYSGGSIASGWAAELQGWYAPELDIKAVAVGGFVVDLLATVELVNGTPYVGFVPPGVLGLGAEYPELQKVLMDQIKPDMMDKASQALSQCVLEDLVDYAGFNVFDFFKDGDAILNNQVMNDTLSNNTLGSSTPVAPMIVYNGIEDQIAPIGKVDETVTKYCNDGGKVLYYRVDGKDHVGTSSAMDGKILDSFADIFAGKVWDSCQVEGLPIGEFGNNTVPKPKVFPSSNSTNSTGNTTSSMGSNSTQTSVASGSESGSAVESGSAAGSATISGEATKGGAATGSATKGGSATGSATKGGSATGSASGSATGSASESSANSANAAVATGITGLFGLAAAAIALL